MAMTVRFPEEMDRKLQQLADATHTSKHALVLQATERFLSQAEKSRRVIESLDETSRDYADTIKRLEDA